MPNADMKVEYTHESQAFPLTEIHAEGTARSLNCADTRFDVRLHAGAEDLW